MAEAFNVLKRVSSFSISPEEQGYTKVILYAGVDDDGNSVTYQAGDDTGKTLEIKNDIATQQMAEKILQTVRGFQYQPYSAEDAQIDPSAELGDAVTINGVYSGIYRKTLKFGRQALADLAAPGSPEIEHAFNLESASDRTFSRFVKSTRSMISQAHNRITFSVDELQRADEALHAELDIQASKIAAKVESKKAGSWNSFGWELTDSAWKLFAKNSVVMQADVNGIEVNGTVKANSFSTFGGEVLTSAKGTFTGTTYAGEVDYGGNAGYLSGSGLSAGSVYSGRLSSGVNSSLSNGDDAFDTIFGNVSNYANIKNLFLTNVWLGDYKLTRGYCKDKDGTSIPVVRWM